jgi:predicted transcriptional regulator
MSAKDTRLTFRVRSQLKKKLEVVAAAESRSVAQICEAFIQAGLVTYEKEGARYISHFLALPDAPQRNR